MDNTTLVVVLVGALVAGLALLFLVGAPSAEPEATAAAAASTTDVATSAQAGTYWQPVSSAVVAVPSPGVAAVAPAYPVGYEPTTPCSACGARTTALPPGAAGAPALVGGCGNPVEPCGAPPCGAPFCAKAPSCGAAPTCAVGCAKAPSCEPACAARPQINRNMPLCVDECSFIQLHASVPQPTCRGIRFEWSATKGYFLDPKAGDPIYFAPTSYFPYGEDVWVTMTLVDAQGVRYTDQVQLHVNNVR